MATAMKTSPNDNSETNKGTKESASTYIRSISHNTRAAMPSPALPAQLNIPGGGRSFLSNVATGIGLIIGGGEIVWSAISLNVTGVVGGVVILGVMLIVAKGFKASSANSQGKWVQQHDQQVSQQALQRYQQQLRTPSAPSSMGLPVPAYSGVPPPPPPPPAFLMAPPPAPMSTPPPPAGPWANASGVAAAPSVP